MARRQSRAAGEPRPPEIGRSLERIDAARFTRHSRWDDVELVAPDLALVEAVEPRLSALRIDGGDLGDAKIVHLTLEDAELLRIDAANVKLRSAVLRRVRVAGARLTGANLGEAELYDVSIQDCRLDYAFFNRARLTDVHLQGTDLREADLTGARLVRVRFDGCDLTGVDLAGVECTDCEMRDCRLDDARSVASLRGVSMPIGDIVAAAELFARSLGIVPLRDHEPG